MSELLSMKRISFELKQLQKYCGSTSDSALKSIEWETDHTFASGVRAPPWRESKGELCYLIAETLDVGRIVITCSQTGYFRNEGYEIGTGGVEKLIYTAVGDVYQTLDEVLKAHSGHYRDNTLVQPGYWNGWDVEEVPEIKEESSRPSDLLHIPVDNGALRRHLTATNSSTFGGRERSNSALASRPHTTMSLASPLLRPRTPSGAMPDLTGSGHKKDTSSSPQPLNLLSPQWEELKKSKEETEFQPRSRSSTFVGGSSPNPVDLRDRGRGRSASPLLSTLLAPRSSSALGQVSDDGDSSRPRSRSNSMSPHSQLLSSPGSSPIPSENRPNVPPLKLPSRGSQSSGLNQRDQLLRVAVERSASPRPRTTSFMASPPKMPLTPAVEPPPMGHEQQTPRKNFGAVLAALGERFAYQQKMNAEGETEPGTPSGETDASVDSSEISLTHLRSSMHRLPRRREKPKVHVNPDADLSEESEEEDLHAKPSVRPDEYREEHLTLHKLSKQMLLTFGSERHGNEKTALALGDLSIMALDSELVQTAVRDVGALDPLIKLLKAPDAKLRNKATEILIQLSTDPVNAIQMRRLGGIQFLLDVLQDESPDTRLKAATIVRNISANVNNRKELGALGGLRILIQMLNEEKEYEVLKATSEALAVLSVAPKCQRHLIQSGSVGRLKSLAGIAVDRQEDLMIPILAILRNVSRHRISGPVFEQYQIEELVMDQISKDGEPLLTACCNCFANLLVDQRVISKVVGRATILTRLGQLLKTYSNSTSEVLPGILGCLARATTQKVVANLINKMDSLHVLIQLLGNTEETVQQLAAAVIANLCKREEGRKSLQSKGGAVALVQLLTSTNSDVVVSVCNALASSAMLLENMKIITDNDGVRLLWSLFKSKRASVQAAAARAVCPCVNDRTHILPVIVSDSFLAVSAASVRWLVGGLPLLVSLLDSDEEEVQAAACGAIAAISKDEQNVAVITEYGVVAKLAHLTETTNDEVRKNLSDALYRVAPFGDNKRKLGELEAVKPVVDFLTSEDPEVHRATAQALQSLTADGENSLVARQAGAVSMLVALMKSTDAALQEAAAAAISNIRRFHVTNMEALDTHRVMTERSMRQSPRPSVVPRMLSSNSQYSQNRRAHSARSTPSLSLSSMRTGRSDFGNKLSLMSARSIVSGDSR